MQSNLRELFEDGEDSQGTIEEINDNPQSLSQKQVEEVRTFIFDICKLLIMNVVSVSIFFKLKMMVMLKLHH